MRKLPSVQLCLALGLSLFVARGRQMTLDESVSLHTASHTLHYDFTEIFKEIHTPSYDAALCAWLKIFGTTHSSAVAFSVVLGLLSIVGVYAFARRLWDREIATGVSLLLALSPLHVFYSQYARTYAYFIAISALSSFSYLLLSRGSQGRWSWVYVVSTYLMITSHLAAFGIVLAQWIHWAIGKAKFKQGPGVKHWLLLHAIIALLYVPFVWIILHNYDLGTDVPRFYAWVQKPGLSALLLGFEFLAGHSVTLSLSFVALAVYAVCKSPSFEATYLWLWLCVPMATLFVLSWAFHPVFIDRGFSPSAVPLLLLAIMGIRFFPASGRRLVLGCAALLSLWLNIGDRFMMGEDWKKVSERLSARAAGEAIFVRPAFISYPFAYYFKRECFEAREVEPCLQESAVFPVTTAEEIALKLPRGKRFWLVGYDVDRAGTLKTIADLTGKQLIQASLESEPYETIELFKLQSSD